MRRLGLAFLISLPWFAALQARTADAGTWTEDVKLYSRDPYYGEYFGRSVAVDDSMAVVGAWQDDGTTGAAYVFGNTPLGWWPGPKLTASDAAIGDHFGGAVELSGDYAVIGAHGNNDAGDASGSAYVFRYTGSAWVEDDKLTASDAAMWDTFGRSVAISGTTVLVGADGNDPGGCAYIFDRISPGLWNETITLTGSDTVAPDNFGRSVSIDGNYAIVGAHYDEHVAVKAGSAYVFRKVDGNWSEVAKLTASDAAEEDFFGCSVAISGTTAVVGAFGDNDCGSLTGAAYVFQEIGGTWTQVTKLHADDASSVDVFGCSVGLDGDTAIIGARREGWDHGAAYVFERSGGVWSQAAKLTASDRDRYQQFGNAVDVDGAFALVGAHRHDNPEIILSGDANRDTKIDGGDLAIWQSNYDPMGDPGNNWVMGDWNNDGKIDGGDLALWQQNYNPLGLRYSGAAYIFEETLTSGPGVEPIPEPGSICLLGVAAAGLIGWQRGRRTRKGKQRASRC